MSTALVPRKVEDVTKLIMSKKSAILSVLPRGIDGDLVLRKAITEIRKNRDLLKCTPASLFHAVADAVANGLEIGGTKAHSYIVPYGDEAVLQVGYKGFLELLRRTGQLIDTTFEMVHEGDEFAYQLGDKSEITHVPSSDPDRMAKPVTHVYVVFRLKDGGIVRNVWTAAQIQAHKEQYSVGWKACEAYLRAMKAKKQKPDPKKLSPWHTNWRSMAIKTLVRDTFGRGRLPMTDSVQQLIERDMQIEAGQAITRDRTLDSVLSESVHQELAQPERPQIEVKPPSLEELKSSIPLELADATSLAGVSAVREKYEELFADDPWLDVICSEREEQIRAERSEGGA